MGAVKTGKAGLAVVRYRVSQYQRKISQKEEKTRLVNMGFLFGLKVDKGIQIVKFAKQKHDSSLVRRLLHLLSYWKYSGSNPGKEETLRN